MTSLFPSWLFLQTTTFTPTVSGKYRVVCIGKGGDGGTGAVYSSYNRYYYCMSGSGGGAGGIGIGEIDLTAGQAYSIAVTNSETNFGNGRIIAKAGSNGQSGTYDSDSSSVPTTIGGAGGTVSGADVLLRYPGSKGGNGVEASDGDVNIANVQISNGGAGGSVTCSLDPQAFTDSAIGAFPFGRKDGAKAYASYNESTVDQSKEVFGGYVGAGGDGSGGLFSGNAYNEHHGTPGKGGPGAVLIELIET